MENIVKIIVIGDPGVGKSSIISRFIRGEDGRGRKDTRISQYDPDVSVKEIELDGQVIKVRLQLAQMWINKSFYH